MKKINETIRRCEAYQAGQTNRAGLKSWLPGFASDSDKAEASNIFQEGISRNLLELNSGESSNLPESDTFGGLMKIFLLVVTILATTGCSSYVSHQAFPLEVADPVSVRGCRPIGTFPGPYGYRYWGPPPVLGDFKYQSALKAKEAGATHIYWREASMGFYGETRVIGYAFDCSGVNVPESYADPYPY